jgi:hypothetical protein
MYTTDARARTVWSSPVESAGNVVQCCLTVVSGQRLSWQRVRSLTVELLVSVVASGTMVMMVLVGGEGAGGLATASMIVPAPEPRTVESEIDDSDAVVATRRKAAAREVERQWHANESAVDGPVIRDAHALAPAAHTAP